MKISIIIAYYNAEQYIKGLLDELLDQGFTENEFEIIVVDDESTHSVDVLKDYCAKHHNVKYVWQKNARQSAARNHGISLAQGEYLFFCDNDDKVNRGVLSRIYDVAHDNNLDMLFFNRLIINEKETPPSHKMDFELKESICSGQQYVGEHPTISTGPWHFIISKQMVEMHDIRFPNGIIICEDVDFLAKASEVAMRVSYVNVDVYYWIQRPKSISHYAGKKKMAEKYIGDMLWNLKERKRQLGHSDTLLPSFRNWIEMGIHTHAFSIVHNAFRYLSIHNNRIVINKLTELGEYPLNDRRLNSNKLQSILCRIMNHKTIWLMLCKVYRLLPLFVRIKF